MASAFDLRIVNGTVLDGQRQYRADIGIKDGLVGQIREGGNSEELVAVETIDAAGKYILPGAIDCHVHFRQPGYEQKEDWSSGSRAAAFGGVTTVIEMPNTEPPTDTADQFFAKRELAEKLSYVDFALYGLLTDTSYKNIDSMYEAGVVGFKCYLSNSASSHIAMIGDGSLLEAFENLARIGARCVIHAENGSIIENRTARLKSAGRTDGRAHAKSRPQVCAVEAVGRSIVLAEATGAPIHIAHESTGAALDLISKAKSRNVNVTVETCPQYLLLSEDDLARAGGIFRCNPPLRQNEDQQRLWRGIRSGEIDVIATDHAPHTQKEKLNSNIWQCQCGMLGVETAMSLMLTEVASEKLTMADYVRLSATNPAKIWGLYPKKGTIKVGSDADIVIVDLAATARIDQDRLHSKNKISAWHGRRVQGIPTTTIVRGKVVVREGQLVGERGWGRYVQQIRS